MKTYFIILLATLWIQGCIAVQTWDQQPDRTEVNPGDSVVMSCKIYNKRGNCFWQKDGKPQAMFTGKYESAGDEAAGDCSIRILDAAEVDDGAWECQVSASSFTAHDALTSNVAQLIVRVKPSSPYLEVNTNQIAPGQNFTVKEGRPGVIKCISRYGNPPADIRWFLGSDEIPEKYYNQTNATEVDRPKTWMAVSTLQNNYIQKDHGRTLRCIALHEAYKTKSKESTVILDVQYAPTVTLQGAPTGDLEENVDSVSLRCLVDSNPQSNVFWRVVGKSDVFSFKEVINFNPIARHNSATYTCEARNSVGGSDPLSVNIDVKYNPRIVRVTPGPRLTATLHNHTMLECVAEANPPPEYTWVQRRPGSAEEQIRGHNATLVLDSVSYDDQGQYICIASNSFKKKERAVQSDPIVLEVVGAPQVLRYHVQREVEVEKGEDALIQMIFCSDPQPQSITWEWGSLQLDAGNGNGRYVAENPSQEATEDCYNAKLRVQHTDLNDQRNYYLNVANEKGSDRYAVALSVREPLAMQTVIGIVTTCLVLLVIVTLAVLYAFKTEKCCFSQRGDFKPADLDSEKSDIESQKAAHGRGVAIVTGRELTSALKKRANESGGTMVGGSLASIPPQALYSASSKKDPSASEVETKPVHEYENRKISTTAMGTPSSFLERTNQQRISSSSSNSSSRSRAKRDERPSFRKNNQQARQSRFVDVNNAEEEEHFWNHKILKSKHSPPANSRKVFPASPITDRFAKRQSSAKTESKRPKNFQETKEISSEPNIPRYSQIQEGESLEPLPKYTEINPYKQRFQPGSGSPRHRGGIVYAELQLPRASNFGSMRMNQNSSNSSSDNPKQQSKTQYAEITFKGKPLQTAEI